ncbi:putative MFS family arabinose efflux permease [Saccharomonospora amisosensis]|uniref:Putative MFS family arabinose efflux permease n=1 Tax=Saccharomonospora amisosensis TaxID=1128677 RepID=A0A7X5ZPI9_9PSEU|nr:MFS transporter [Saccharomonospora amisosensis]NIJ10838.1 putative MFS family arabinose efflux permease [Saccharomonospora amisosensis]
MAVTTQGGPEAAGRVHTAAFWLVAVALFLLMFAASAPSPLYVVYQRMWGFTPATLTAVFAVYVLGLLVMLVSAGALSDYVGRKPVLVSAIVAEAGSMLLFVLASDVGWLYAARILQGLATGAATGAISAALIDLERKPGTGALVNSATPTAGLAVGALGVGLLVQFAPAPTKLVYILLLVAFIGTVIALLFIPEPVRRKPGALRSLRPRLGVPPGKLRAFLVALPSLVVPWMLGGLYLSLGRSLVVDILGIANPVAGGLVVFLLTGTGAVASVLARNWAPQAAMTVGASALAIGVAAVLIALAVAFAPLFFAATVLGGFGFGVTFLGAFRTATGLAEPGGRAALVATIYTACYLSFSLPSLAAGLAATHVGLPATATWYGLMVITFAVVAIVARRFSQRVR